MACAQKSVTFIYLFLLAVFKFRKVAMSLVLCINDAESCSVTYQDSDYKLETSLTTSYRELDLLGLQV